MKKKPREADLNIINNIVQSLRTKTNPCDIYKEVVYQIGITLKCTHCTLFIPKRENNKEILIPIASWSNKGNVNIINKFKSDEGLIGLVYNQASSQIFSDAASHPNFVFGKGIPVYHKRSMLISPIISGGETIGLISADQDELNWFSEKNLKLVDTLAIHIGVAIERSLMLKATKEISERLIGVLNPEHMNVILDIVLKTAVELTKATTGVIYLLDNDKKSIIKTCVFPDNSFHPPPRKNKSGQFIGLTRRALDSKEGFIIEQKDINDQVNPELRDKIKSMAVYPLISRDNVVGILFLDDSNGHIYSQVEKLILETLANQVGIALTSYNLINELERTKQEYFDLFGESVKDRDIITSKMFYHEISHNVKNVLTQVQINMELITNNPSMRRISSTQRGRMDQLISRVQKSVDSIEEFLDLASEPEVKKVPWKVKDLVDYALRLLEGKIEDKEIQIDLTNLDCNIPAIKVNPIQMIMAFVNLIDNAIYAMEKVNRNRRLRIYTRESSPWIEVMFEDNGCGISKDDLHKLFTPFFSTKEKKGRGIGLIGTQRIIEMHHGKLPRPFSILGKETIFTVYLPKT